MSLVPGLRLAVPSILLLAGCSGSGQDQPGSTDVRIDHAPKGIESMAPRSCIADRAIYVAWYDQREDHFGVWFNRSLDAGRTWMPSDIRLNHPEVPADATDPDVACSGDRVYVTWDDRRDGELENGNIYFNVSEDGGETWSQEDVALDADPDGEAMSLGPRIAAAGSAVYVAWFDARNGAYDIYLNSSTDGGVTWLDAPVRVDGGGAGEAYSASPVVAADGEGGVLVAWEDSRDGYSDVYVNRSTDHGRSFSSDTRLDGGQPGEADSFRPVLLLSGSDAYVAWHDNRDTGGWDAYDVYLSHSSDGGATWPEEPTRVPSTATGLDDARYPALAALGAAVHVAWQDDRSGGYDIEYRRSGDGGGSWLNDEYRLDRDAAGAAQSYDALVGAWSDGLVVVAWADRRDDDHAVGFNDLYYNYSLDGGESWSASDRRINANAPGSAYASDLWMGRAGGKLEFVWEDGRSGSSDIYTTALAVGDESVYVPPADEGGGG